MNKKNSFLEGIKQALGFVLVLSIIGVVYGAGFHVAGEVLSGTFLGDYVFSGDVDLSSANIIGIGSVPSGGIMMFNSSCPSGWSNLSAMDGKFPRGATTFGGTGGTDDAVVVSHVHSVDPPITTSNSNGAHTHSYTQFHTSGPNSAAGVVGLFGYYASTTGSAGAHTHTTDITAFDSASTGVSGLGANVPAYIDVIYCIKD